MKYLKFIIKNYKGIKDELTLDLTNLPNSNIFTLVGLNESGKTSILEAIDLLQNKVSDENAHRMIHKSKKGDFNDIISISAQLELDSDDEKRIKEYCIDKLNYKITRDIENIEITKEYSFKESKFQKYQSLWKIPLFGTKGKGKKEISLHKYDESSWSAVVKYIETNFPKILYYRNFLFDFPQKIYLTSFEGESKEQKEYRKVLQDILDSLQGNQKIETHLHFRLENPSAENSESLEATLGEISEKLTKTIFSNWGDIFTKSSKEIELKTGKEESKGHYIELKIKQGRDKFSIEERSLGFRWFFSFLLFTEFRKERKEDFGETLFLLDEPASNLHQKSQMKLLNIFQKISEKCKIIYSTHSHHLINPKNLAGTCIIKNKAINYDNEITFNQNETEVTATLYKNFVSKHPNETDHFKPILDAIDYIPSGYELVEKIILLEGKSDYYTLKYFQELNGQSKVKFNFYPGASVSKFDDILRLYLSWNKKIFGLFDSDNQGKKEKNRYIKNISIELQDSLFLLSDIDKSWENYTTENLFEEGDKMKIINSLFPLEKEYNKSKFNTAIQDIYINKKSVVISKKTKDRFLKIFNYLAESISK
jgi:predicted ATPase